ncbi:hypothetical protein [Cohnella sp. GbtcB17]|uniref:hypothetical protein n=1 Tax=Cohnella sp. GbtcB17 TaxID=2824762 RepID=UPI001C30AB40|nr:hypothetical protein [Cohnella sp. GbtcB17]
MSKRLRMDLQLFAGEESETGVEGASAAGEQTEGNEGDQSQTGVEGQGAAAEQGQQNNFEKAFAKRLAAEREKWDADRKAELDQYKDFDAYKKAAEYLQRTSGISDLLTLKEEIELVELQERAEKENVPASVLKRIDELEAKAKKGEELEAAELQKQEWQSFEASLKEFATDKQLDGKPLDHMELWKYMHENEVSKPEVAFRAMKADLLEKQLETAEKDAIDKYLKSKQGPKTEGAQGAAATQNAGPPTSWKEAEQRMAERLRAAREAQ